MYVFYCLAMYVCVECLLRRSRITINDILSALEDDDDFNKADIYLTPPDNGAGSDEDSGGEDCVSANNLSGKQLRAQAVAVITRNFSHKDVVGEDSSTESDVEDDHSVEPKVLPQQV